MVAGILSNDMNTPEMERITKRESIGLLSPLSRITSTNLPLIPTRIKSGPIIEQTRTSYPTQSRASVRDREPLSARQGSRRRSGSANP
ncbi:hypothetical protein PSTG_03674 [Puccinia striiformis f. sp. tritici PST-78]|uniref:Uncharacterized protein n=1 Tax=Puccinia striiformis f. sp. tritici PST-78 TaxID=1165861 RepID=A0A0L0VUY4_9BASI|nr:hypothetical protein PSTG_03674 [Puccinia striiformis f. sp. tritici PST-78]